MKNNIILLGFILFMLCGCKSPIKKHFIINENDTIASLIERNDSLIRINTHQYDLKDWRLNREMVDFFNFKPYECLAIKDNYHRDEFNGRYNKNPNGYKLYMTGKLDTIAYLAFNNYDIGTYIKTPFKIDDEKWKHQIMDIFNVRSCDFYVMNGEGINNMEIYSSIDLDCIETSSDTIVAQSLNECELEDEEDIEDNDIYIPSPPIIGLKDLECTLDYLYYILTDVLCMNYTEEEHALYHAIAIRDIGEFAIKSMISSNEEVRKKANRIISYLDKYQSSDLKSIRSKLVYYYLQNSRKYDLKNVDMAESRLNSKGDMVYTLYLESKRFVSEDYCLYVVNNRDNIIGFAGFNYITLIGPNDKYYNFPIYCGKNLNPELIGWPNNKYESDKRKSIEDILKNIERFYNPF